MRVVVALSVTGLALLSAGCGVSGVTNGTVANMERVRNSPSVRDGARFAPQEFELAENERVLSQKASRDGDEIAASLYGEQATASYTDAVVLARLARATIERDKASSDLARDEARAQKLAGERAEAELVADELSRKLRIAREALTPATSVHADPEREEARVVAARALVAEARLLCGAAGLLSASLDGLDALTKDVDALDTQLEKPGRGAGAPIDTAARARAGCLALLTRARRTSDASQQAEPDALLSELSASGQFEPSRDERGVVIVLRDAFKGTSISWPASKALAELGRVAVAHPGFAIQVVVHDATPPSASEASADVQRAQAAVAALVSAGAPVSHVKAETVGARAPLVDPQDPRHRARNARLEVVFVSPGS
jgi:flagellar motor protein MotB